MKEPATGSSGKWKTSKKNLNTFSRDGQGASLIYPIPSINGIFSYIYHENQPNVGEYAIHGWYGYEFSSTFVHPVGNPAISQQLPGELMKAAKMRVAEALAAATKAVFSSLFWGPGGHGYKQTARNSWNWHMNFRHPQGIRFFEWICTPCIPHTVYLTHTIKGKDIHSNFQSEVCGITTFIPSKVLWFVSQQLEPS